MSDLSTTALHHWLRRRNLPTDAVRPDEPVAVVFDGVRVRVLPRTTGLLLETRLSNLPAGSAQRDALLEKVLRLSAARLWHNTATLSVDDSTGAIWLQQLMPTDATPEALDEAVGSMVSETEHWRGLL